MSSRIYHTVPVEIAGKILTVTPVIAAAETELYDLHVGPAGALYKLSDGIRDKAKIFNYHIKIAQFLL